MRAETTNGSVTLALGAFNDNEISASSTNGGITLRLPDSPNARLEARNSNSSITNEVMPFAVEDQAKHRLIGKFGSGGPLIQLHTSTGSIHISKY